PAEAEAEPEELEDRGEDRDEREARRERREGADTAAQLLRVAGRGKRLWIESTHGNTFRRWSIQYLSSDRCVDAMLDARRCPPITRVLSSGFVACDRGDL